MLKRVFTGLLVVSSLSIAASANAHFLWASIVSGNQVRIELAESPGTSVVPMKVKKAEPGVKSSMIPYNAGRFSPDTDNIHLVGPLQSGKQAGGVNFVYGLHGTSLIHWSAKGIATVHDGAQAIGLPAEILLRKIGNRWAAIVTRSGKPVADADVEVYVAGASNEIKLKSGHDGSVVLPSLKKGLLAIGAIITIPGAGDYKGGHFNDTKEMASLTVQIP